MHVDARLALQPASNLKPSSDPIISKQVPKLATEFRSRQNILNAPLLKGNEIL